MNEAQMVEIFGSVVRFRALRALFAEPGRGFGQRELAAEAGIDPGGVAKLLKRWVASGLVTRRQQDGLPRYHASADPALAPLVALMQQDSALVSTLKDALAPVPGVAVALVFGSVARGEAGADSDVDVLVLGSASELKVNAALKPAGRMLGRAVHATASTIEAFMEQVRAGEGFAQDIVQGPRIALLGSLENAILSNAGG
ncbi:MAG: nucleotidyltransferase domain-containing protein [Hydrogenophaga sp.]|uniref:nucleotidyltransferase domain-containing protein n=1 Tax=Hydrogenophaga sp. TaxID=1904254 RepID=UPI0027554D80|nr:nucleotidyltransferase domain-containing protein [Hydrogenophaga sp.]MDP2416162.1 nucleotidyltransferase domain-containing protein [Hydrogenophaga sp.]MDZ4190091.1 nucleotidyltransferase domain-containing protein [Hydrogenophaga sp.]